WDEWYTTVLRHVPPPADLVEAGRKYLGPAAGSALIVFALVLLIFGRRSALPAGSLAMLVGFGVANYRYELFPWWPPAGGRFWLPLLFLGAQVDGLLARSGGVPFWGRWRLRLGIGLLAALLLVPPDLHKAWPSVWPQWPYLFQAKAWPLAAFTLVVAFGWAGSEAVARQSPGGVVGVGLSLALFGASIVVLHAHSGSLAEMLTFPAAALLGVSVAALFCKVDIGGAVPGVALLCPALVLVGFHETFDHHIPWFAFLLAGIPLLTTGLLAVPPLSRLTGFRKWALFWVLCLGPTIAAVTLAVRAESLVEEW
ncbi:MAG TPA: hypothetical protein VKE40_01555, partial [Gemmataceae bacterium]|nr:hypothetical protein [Gemmataceae bacterium]